MKITPLIFLCVIMLVSLVVQAYETPTPFNKDFLLNSQEHVAIVGVDQANPPERLDLLVEILQARSSGGNAIFWSALQNNPSAITTHIPAHSGPDDVLQLLHELKEVYQLSDVGDELDVRLNTSDIPVDSGGRLPPTQYIIFQHVCRFTDGTVVDVANSRFFATLNSNGYLVTLSSSYQSIDCIYPEGHMSESAIHQLFPGITSSIKKEILPPGKINGVSGGTYIYSFSTGSAFYEVRADNGGIINVYPHIYHSHGFSRVVKDPNSSLVVCQDTNPNSSANSSGGSSCIDPFSYMYDSLFWAVSPWNGSSFFSQLLGKSVNWGFGNKLSIDVEYNPAQGTTLDDLGAYSASNGGTIKFSRWVSVQSVGLLGVNAVTRFTDNNGQSLPGLGGVVDLVSHEVGHGYIAAFLKAKHGIGAGIYLNGSGLYKVGSAITEALADIFGKLGEGHARYSKSNCTTVTHNSPPVPNCGENPFVSCGTGQCGIGEYCGTGGTCTPCHSDCPTQSPAVINWNFATKYIDNDEDVFTNSDVFGRKIWKEDEWTIICPRDNNSNSQGPNMQVYGNSVWFSGLIGSFSSKKDPLFSDVRGYIRNVYDLGALETIMRQVLKHLNSRPSAFDAFAVFAAGLAFHIRIVPDQFINGPGIQRSASLALNSMKPWRSSGTCVSSQVSGLCLSNSQNCCNSTSRYICSRNQ